MAPIKCESVFIIMLTNNSNLIPRNMPLNKKHIAPSNLRPYVWHELVEREYLGCYWRKTAKKFYEDFQLKTNDKLFGSLGC